jgi:tetratricopeptide (TPR) repeat protein
MAPDSPFRRPPRPRYPRPARSAAMNRSKDHPDVGTPERRPADLGATATIIALLSTLGAVLFIFRFGNPGLGSDQMWIVASPYKALAGMTLTLFTAGVFAVWWVERGLSIRWTGTLWALAVVGLLSVLSTLVSSFPWISVERLIELALCGTLIFIIVQTLRRPHHFAAFSAGILVIGAVVVGFGLLQALNQTLRTSGLASFFGTGRYPFMRADRVYSFMVNPNFLGATMVMLLPMTFAGVLAFRRTGVRLLVAALSAATLIVLLLAFSRGPILGGLVGAIAFYALSYPQLKRQFAFFRRWRAAITLAVAALVGLVLLIGAVVLEANRSDAFQGGTMETRLILWRGSVQAFLARPLFGHGIGAYQPVIPTYRPTDYRKERLVSFNSDHAHNEVLELLTDFGLIGFAACLAVVVLFLRAVVRHLARPRSMEELRSPQMAIRGKAPQPGPHPHPVTGPDSPVVVWFGLGAAAGVIGEMAESLVGVSIRWASGFYFFSMLFGLALAAAATMRGLSGRRLALSPSGRNLARLLVYPALLALLIHAAIISSRRGEARALEQDADTHMQVAGIAASQGANEDAVRAIRQLAADLIVTAGVPIDLSLLDDRNRPGQSALDPALRHQILRDEVTVGLFLVTLKKLLRSAELDPHLLETLYRLGHCHHMLGRLSAVPRRRQIAETLAKDYFGGNPSNAVAPAEIDFNPLAQEERALYWYGRLAALAPNYTRIHKQVGVILNGMGRHEEAVQSLLRDLVFNPDYDNAETRFELSDAYLNLGHGHLARAELQRLAQLDAERLRLEADLKALNDKQDALRKERRNLSRNERTAKGKMESRLRALRDERPWTELGAQRLAALASFDATQSTPLLRWLLPAAFFIK